MVRRVSSREARDNFAELLGRVYYTREPVIVERKGKPYAVLVSPDQYERFMRDQAEAWSVVEEIREQNADKDPDAILALVTEEVEAVRQELYDERRGSAERGG